MIESAEEFIRLRTSDRPEDYQRAASEEAPVEVWMKVIACHPEMRFWVAHNKTVPFSVLDILSADEDGDVRHMVASKNKLTRELFARLAADVNESVRHRIAMNKNTPADILMKLAQDECRFVAQAAVKKIDGP